MRTQRTPLLLATIAAYAFGRNACDPFAIPDPDIGGGSSICGITQRGVGHEVCHAPDDGSNGGNSAKKIELTQEELDALIQKRVGPLQDKLKAREGLDAKVADLEKRLGEADAEKAKAAEEAELKGKTELEKLQIQLDKSSKQYKQLEESAAKLKNEYEGKLAESGKQLTDYVKRSYIAPLLAANAAEGASKFAEMGFFTEAQIELNEDRTIKSIAVAGKTFDKPDDAVKAFYEQNKVLARPPEKGGSGGPRNGSGGGNSDKKISERSSESLFEEAFTNS